MTFEEFVAVRLPALLRQATALAGDPHLAEDVVQDVLIKVQPRWMRIRELDLPELYIRKMIVNELMSARRRVAAAIRRERVQPPIQEKDRAELVVQRDALLRLIRALPPRQRIVIALRYYEDMADGDIAVLMGCSVATVRSQASRALAKLRSVAELEPARGEE
ncbi:SigE family RNA polymerase sigma factor [Micromonospora sp. NIE79]|uniref:SigE family RNA polymerase sigma factor n=1 Tax=Micromonospora trifolii TaxID=2911208 RepID=A0ABS9N6H3_9ACTN|nr:SigE family RNA polymerase sigma factor [Micromonospora trifolii]MCG5445550.1 SigE family RNA polymerase sigma factor [Micromonospora trifolii]